MSKSMTLTERVLGRGARAAYEGANETSSLHDRLIDATIAALESPQRAPGGPKRVAADDQATTLAKIDSSASNGDVGRLKRTPNAGPYEIVSDPPPPSRRSLRGYPWRQMQVGQAFFAPGTTLVGNRRIAGCEGWEFVTYSGTRDGVPGRWAKRVK